MTIFTSCQIIITVSAKETYDVINKPEVYFCRFDSVQGYREEEESERGLYVVRFGLSKYWSNWLEVAKRAEFDFNYLTTLKPIEMRFYELIQLLRFKDAQKTTRELKKAPLEISYDDLCQFMPLLKMNALKEIETQINDLCFKHMERGWLKKVDFNFYGKNDSSSTTNLNFSFE